MILLALLELRRSPSRETVPPIQIQPPEADCTTDDAIIGEYENFHCFFF